MLTPEEQRELEELELKRLTAQREKAMRERAGVTTTITGQKFQNITPEMVQAENDKVRFYDRPRHLAQGATLGFSDEIEAAVRAPFSDKTFGELQTEIAGEMDAYAEANPYEATALEVTGGLLTGGMGAGRSLLGGQGRRQMQKTLGRMEARQASRQSSRMPHLAPVDDVARTGSSLPGTIGRGAVGGGIAGFGYSDGSLQDRLEGAAQGATAGSVLGGALGSARKGFETLSKRRLAQTLGQGDDFVPIHLASPGGMGRDMMQNLVGRSMGGGSRLLEQSRRWATSPAQRAARAAEKLENFPQMLRQETAAARRAAIKESAALKKAEMERLNIAQGKAAAEIEGINVPGPDPKTLQRAAKEKAINPTMPSDVKAKIRAGDTRQAAEELDTWWTKNGFKLVKKRSYDIDDKMRKELGEFMDDPDLADIIGEMGKGRKKITGQRLMDLRNAFARPSNRTQDRWSSGKLRRMRDKVDKHIEAGLDEAELSAFRKELAAWGDKETFISAVTAAGGKKQGAFDFDDWMNALGKAPGRKRTYGKGTLQDAAEAGQKGTLAAKAQTAQQKAAAKKEADSRFKQTRQAVKERAANLRDKRIAMAERRRKAPLRKALLKDKKAQAQTQAEGVMALSPPSESTGLSQMLAAQSLSPNLAGRGKMAGLLSGTGVSTALSTQNMQRFMAGQTRYQEDLARLLRENPELIDQMIRGTTRVAGGKAGE